MSAMGASRATSRWLAAVLAVTLAGCSISVRSGRRPDVNLLETSLQVGASTKADVARELGAPVDRSMSALPMEAQPRTIWTYYYSEGSLKDARAFFLIVYFVDDRYDGYLWFSSFPN